MFDKIETNMFMGGMFMLLPLAAFDFWMHAVAGVLTTPGAAWLKEADALEAERAKAETI